MYQGYLKDGLIRELCLQTIRRHGVEVARGLALVFGIGTTAVPSWDSRLGGTIFTAALPATLLSSSSIGQTSLQSGNEVNALPPFCCVRNDLSSSNAACRVGGDAGRSRAPVLWDERSRNFGCSCPRVRVLSFSPTHPTPWNRPYLRAMSNYLGRAADSSVPARARGLHRMRTYSFCTSVNVAERDFLRLPSPIICRQFDALYRA